ncbi:MAG: hypothetical protein HDS82_05125 [Bacteroidales bacterium]|nr:hypothetical protein [Bacteroidales bacterium]
MSNKLLVAALAAGIALPVAALPVLNLTSPKETLSTGFQAREVVAQKAPAQGARISKAPAKKVIPSINEDLSEVEKYGKLELCFSEDFSRLKKGSIEEPYQEEILHYYDGHENYQYPWNNMLPELTEVPGWGVGNAYDGGECLYFPCWEGEGHVNTPIWDLTGEGGNVAVLEFKARAPKDSTYDWLMVESAETNHWAPSWDMNDNILISGITDEWCTIRLIFLDCGPSFLFNIVGINRGEVFIDDIKVYKMTPYLHIPTPTGHREYKGSEFTIGWTASPGVDQYRVNVYDTESNGDIRDYVVKDQIVDGTKFTVTGAESGQTYYYTVAPVKDDIASLACRPCEVTDIETPKMESIETNGEWDYTAKWNLVPGAEVYDYLARYKRTAEEDGEFVVVNENFDGVKTTDGELTGWTKEGVQAGIDDDLYYAKWYPDAMTQKGWYALNGTPFTDYISLAGHYYGANKWDNTALLSPELDLSKDGGKFTVNVDLCGQEREFEIDEAGNTAGFVETAAVVLYTWNDEREDYDQVEMVYVDRKSDGTADPDKKAVSTDWQNYTVTLTKGTSRSIVGIYAIWGISNLYVDNLKITQNYKKGEEFLDPFFMGHYLGYKVVDGSGVIEGGNTVDVVVPAFASGTDIYHQVQAIRAGINEAHNNETVFTTSDWSELEFARTTIVGVGTVEVENAVVTFDGANVNVVNPEKANVCVYALNGTMLYNSNDEAVSYTLPSNGTYIVTCGKKAVKVIF